MATYETKGRLTYKDENSDNHIIYPVTKMDCIEDMPDIETEIAESVAAYLEDNPVETPDVTDQVSRAETAASAAEAAKESASASANNAGGYASVANTHAKNAQTYASSASSSATRAEEAAIRAEEAVASIPESGGGTVKTVNGVVPDENGNVEITIPDSGGNVDLTGYATEQFVRDGFQPKGNYLESTELTNAVNTALAQAKASGEFDGKDGADGQPGKDGADGAPGEKGDKGDKGDPGEPGQKGEQGIQGIPGEKGEKGDTGSPGADGAKGDKGDKGDTGATGAQGEPGKDGANGKDGTSATHSWNGTVLTITSASGTSSADLKGAKGDKGDKGDTGAQGIQGIQGIQGEPGAKGDKGDTGAPGADGKDGSDGFATFTESEYAEITEAELSAKYTDGVRVLLITADENLIPTAVNKTGAIFNGCGYLDGHRLNSSGDVIESERSVVTGYIPYEHGHTIEIAGATNPVSTGGQYIATYDADFNLILVNYMASLVGDSGGSDTCTDDNNHIYTVNTAAFSNANNTNGFKNAKYIRVALNPFIGKKMRVRYV